MLRGVIADMLRSQKKHISFHTPGHKRAGADITELSYSDSLYSPHGAIAKAQEDIAEILGAAKSFLLTDGSTAGVHAMLYALKEAGCRSVAASVFSHPSVAGGCRLAGLNTVPVPAEIRDGIPLQPAEEALARAIESADALLLTSPDYYGNFPPLAAARRLCDAAGKPLLIDGAHGAHLHFAPEYAGNFADMWVDGVHKSLPAFTQGAVVSAKRDVWAERLQNGVLLFRTTSPSYPVMASVEHAVKYPRNEEIERLSQNAKKELRAYPNADWSKIVVRFGSLADSAQEFLERRGIYPEFNDGDYIMFYLSPCTKARELKKLVRAVKKLPAGTFPNCGHGCGKTGKNTAWVPVMDAVGKTCAQDCGVFPPCIPLVCAGDGVSRETAVRLMKAKNTFGLQDGKILVYTEG